MAEQVGRHADRPRGRHGVARLHLRGAARLQARRRLRAGAQARQAARPRRSRSSTSSSTARPRSRSTRDAITAGAARADRRRPARHRRDRASARSSSCGGWAARSPGLSFMVELTRAQGARQARRVRDPHAAQLLIVGAGTDGGRHLATHPRPGGRRPRARSPPSCARDRRYAAYALGRPRRRRTAAASPWAMAYDDAGRPTALAMHHEGLVPQPLFLMGAPDGCRAILEQRAQAARRLSAGHGAPRGGAARPLRAGRARPHAAHGRRPRQLRALRRPGASGSRRSTSTTSTGSTSSASGRGFPSACSTTASTTACASAAGW